MVAREGENKSIKDGQSSRRDRYLSGLSKFRKDDPKEQVANNLDTSEVHNLDWFNYVSEASDYTFEPSISQVAGNDLEDKDRISLFINNLSSCCFSCSMCSRGTQLVCNNDILRDPHVFSNLNISKVMYIKHMPSWSDLELRDAKSSNTDHPWLDLDKVYVTYLIKCAGDQHNGEEAVACASYLPIEINILSPQLILADEQVYDTLTSLGMIDDGVLKARSVSDTKIVNISNISFKKTSVLLKLIDKIIENERSL